ncbi:MAG TPA: tRNA 2-selenouridine(34) synthase MnmH [Accumulibacter sp.]|uniref:tRNA 2-selenouridine(34) synthase MnmH n=1 Tax=Accumulibacter sp. TaxID=2053492 RepID=UPI0025DD476E|nr:tRNA 2-selenouridine(34) synthase MnmH [Accumulibacter sp.]MCM8598982.1 tRNA 2-selenouridine(34) synthase MnmH [Accumulibacter sp.]MCM8663111.1 tRNA 2-selenouridine(34) synthase MnmH [Accumulibacter sp.]HNC52283.1 tRNA 2-selenouridine(34) synthase MnmH [Accumulibacter sp.]
MKHDIATIGRLDELASFDEIIDVRSPAEFAEDHIPGSVNCPVLDNRQRIEVGTLYKQVSPFAARKVGAAHVAENIARHLRERFFDRPKNWQPLVVCWRGGQRSGSLTHVLRRIGWDAQQLEGGYKTYRRLVIEQLSELPGKLRLKVLCGATGSGKSRVLQAIGRLGEQVLDLEELACHKGSVLGALPDCPQPSQKSFESRLLAALQGLDPARLVHVEAESRKIGSLQLPTALIEGMRAGECVNIEASLAARVDFLLRDYAYFLTAPDWLIARLQALRQLQSNETVLRWREQIGEGRWRELVGELLTLHYDPLYQRSQQKNYAGFATPLTFATDDLTPAGIEALARRICSK